MQMQEFCPWFKHEARQMAVKTKSVFVSGDTVMTLRLSPGFGSGPGGVQRRAREVDQEMYAAMGRCGETRLQRTKACEGWAAVALMLRLFRSISRGRRNDDDERNESTWSPYTQSPERTRHRAVGRHIADDHDDGDEDDDDEDDQYSPRRPLNGRRGYFDRADRFEQYVDDEDDDEQDEGNEDALETPLLPIFSAAHLDRLPLYNITHAIRQLIVAKCETTLSWDQLRSPQISQFLVKPIQGQIRADHFNRATLCALIANCLQFQKEGQMSPGNIGVSKTRALISELLAMRLLREFSTRELIDSLSYDFDPLQGMSTPANGGQTPGNATPKGLTSDVQQRRSQGRVARVSTIEVAIRAEAKRFLAHPLVVQHLEAIWAGNIVFHSEADNLHRQHRRSQESLLRGRSVGYGAMAQSPSQLPADAPLSRKANGSRPLPKPVDPPVSRRTVTLYNPHDASLFKLSRLRVPRYRQVFSTLSFATMLVLFVAVLAERSLSITPLEVLFWFWSIGYMLDEVVGFTEQGFGLYILSFWNAFDLGILVLFAVYYVLRLYGIVLAEEGQHKIAGIAYDILASTAILLFPRLFNVLDHYRYFSQLLIAFRLMAQDLVAILVLIVISCSGFFVALSLSFADTRDANGVAYSLFQILMGFTPAVWDHWNGYNFLGKVVMVIFLTLCHFLIVTILITVLTNSFMAIVKNAEEEHQFLFAVNTISMVKSDALFSYVAPTNIVGWALSPIRFLIPLRTYVKINRTIIKISHFPILFVIFSYERTVMARSAYAPTELVERKPIHQKQAVAFTINKGNEAYATSHRLREPSVISFNKDRALDEVFRRPFKGDTVRTTTQEMEIDRRHSTNAVDKWMQAADMEGGASPPMEQPRSVLEQLEYRRPKLQRAHTSDRLLMSKRSRDFSTATRSVGDEPDLLSLTASRRPKRIEEEAEDIETGPETLPQDTEADGDDEINDDVDESDSAAPALGESAISVRDQPVADESESEYFQTPLGTNSPLIPLSHAARARLANSPEHARATGTPRRAQPISRQIHDRQLSTGTIMFAPRAYYDSSTSNPARHSRAPTSKPNSGGATTPNATAILNGQKAPAKKSALSTKARPILPPRQKTAPNVTTMGLSFLDTPRATRREPSFNARALDLASEIGDNKWGPSGGGLSGFPASFSEQMMRERDLQRRREEERRRSEEEEKGMVNRIMLARMHTLEEGFREVLKEIKDMSANAGSRGVSEADSGAGPSGKTARPKLDTAVGSSSGWQTPRTPIAIGRIGGNEKSRKLGHSPRKSIVRANAGKRAGKENERPGTGRTETNEEGVAGSSKSGPAVPATTRDQQDSNSPQSVKSVFEVPKGNEAVEGAADRRPTTAVKEDDLIDLRQRQKDDE